MGDRNTFDSEGRFCSGIQSSSGCFLFQVLVTVPLTLLQRGLLHFHPPLPERKLKAIHSLGAGIIEKIALQFPTRFWDSKIQGADYFGHIPPAPEKRGLFSVFYDLDPQGKQAVLMSVISGDAVPAPPGIVPEGPEGAFPRAGRPRPCELLCDPLEQRQVVSDVLQLCEDGRQRGGLRRAGRGRAGKAVLRRRGHQPTLPSDRDGGLPQRGPRGQQNGCCVSRRPRSPWTPAPPDGWPTRPAWS
ncbi:uncharacterized protein ACNS7B_008943 [Menidia menidia]